MTSTLKVEKIRLQLFLGDHHSVSTLCNWQFLKLCSDSGGNLSIRASLFENARYADSEGSTAENKWWLHSNKQGSNTMPLRHRSDFKQALSTLQRLQQEAGEEPHVPSSYKHKQWAQSSSFTWWNWQGSWWSSCNSESQEGAEPSLEWTGDPFLAVFGKNLRKWLSRIQFILLQLDRLQLTAVYCNWRCV